MRGHLGHKTQRQIPAEHVARVTTLVPSVLTIAPPRKETRLSTDIVQVLTIDSVTAPVVTITQANVSALVYHQTTQLTFNPSYDKKLGVGLVLSNNNRTVSATAYSYNLSRSAIVNTPITANQKVILRFVVEKISGIHEYAGVGIASESFDAINYLGGDTSNLSVGIYNNGALWLNDTRQKYISLLNFDFAPSQVDLAIDRVNNLMWVRVNDNAWNNSATDNPATGSGGVDISMVTGTIYPAATVDHGTSDAVYTLQSFVDNVPAGFTVMAGSS